jgi:hypothetical protein
MRAALILFVVPACVFSSNGMGDDICPLAGDVAVALRDPATGACQSFSGGGCMGVPYPDWAPCHGACDALAEDACQATAGCRAVYTGAIGGPLAYLGCWGTAPGMSIEGGDCTTLDPFTCSEHDDCAAVFAQAKAPPMQWEGCIAEPRRLDPGACDGLITCRAQPPACPSGTVPGVASGCYSGYCIPKTACGGPLDPGTCAGAVCAISSPACPSGTTPGVANGCYTGYCIPDSACSH